MAIKTINIGVVANDGTGDDLREAFVKVNNNFAELEARTPESTTVSNLGTAGEGLFAQKVGTDLQFKKIVAGNGTTVTSDSQSVTINATGDSILAIDLFGDTGTSQININDNALTIAGGQNVTVGVNNNTVTVASATVLSTDATPKLAANLNGDGFEIINTSDIKSKVYGLDIREMDGIQDYINGYDFGRFDKTANNFFEFLSQITDIDLGSFSIPTDVSMDFGPLVL
jgi:hypothetical protein